ncbi:type IV toxin-antitoxin system AbiEi family antitoxin domain-containing protein [Nocardioides sp. BP30]|uniref:type IV toxin-antitoxin system AbiEi family antitoxin domain-containing protein n=1 Tax=Nocardioides sp. BP30 TaxID=3036374 RepID=UPI002469BA86|nr:type IV toxin-antitoxin system AbiEi family antitoxin domain-containing protein [Nocardioides sp. BP30]WGL52353.1 type IV toxin-antitoxin system AbiEi family antitoxin domain-containing protein [Nocardioides sp. BP30]
MNATVIGHMRAQRGLVTRAQATAAGITTREIDAAVRSGRWVAVRRGVYAEQALVATTVERGAKQRLFDDAACLRIEREHVRSHESAGLVLGLGLLLPSPCLTHVTRPTVHGSRHEHGVKHHLAPYAAEDVVEIDGVRCLRAARTAADIAREHGHPYGVVAFDSALRSGVPLAELEAALESMPCWPRIRTARAELELADEGSESVGETLTRMLVIELGHGPPETQFGLTDGRREVWCDLRLHRHIIESDGRIKYRSAAQGGVATRPGQDVLWEEKGRQDFVTGFKLGMSRVVWSDHWGAARVAALARLDREHRDTCRRFGTDIGDLAPYRIQGRRRAA